MLEGGFVPVAGIRFSEGVNGSSGILRMLKNGNSS